jgi:transcriptional regulator with XRE-family HTH domain
MLRCVNRWIDAELADPTVRRGMAVIAEVVRRGRQGAGITQLRLAEASGLHQATISRLERGLLRSMRLVRLARVIGALVEFGGLPPPTTPLRRRSRMQ